MYAQYYAQFNIILNLTLPIKAHVVWIICSYVFEYIFNLDLHVPLYSLTLPDSYEEKILQYYSVQRYP